MRRRAAGLLVVGCWLAASAGAEPAPSLEGVMARLAASPGLRAAFVETRSVALLEEPIEARGHIALQRPDRFARITEVPAFTRLVLDGQELRFEGVRSSDDLSRDPALRRSAEELLLLLGGDLPELRGRYLLEFRVETDVWVMELVPRSVRARRFVERLVLRGRAGTLDSLELREPDGGTAITRFSELDMDRPLSPEEIERFFGAAPRP